MKNKKFQNKIAKGLVSFITIIVLLSSILATTFVYQNNITANVVREPSTGSSTTITITEVNDINELNQLNEGFYEIRHGFVFYLDTFNSYVPLYIRIANIEYKDGLLVVDGDGNIWFYEKEKINFESEVTEENEQIIESREASENQITGNLVKVTGNAEIILEGQTIKVGSVVKPVGSKFWDRDGNEYTVYKNYINKKVGTTQEQTSSIYLQSVGSVYYNTKPPQVTENGATRILQPGTVVVMDADYGLRSYTVRVDDKNGYHFLDSGTDIIPAIQFNKDPAATDLTKPPQGSGWRLVEVKEPQKTSQTEIPLNLQIENIKHKPELYTLADFTDELPQERREYIKYLLTGILEAGEIDDKGNFKGETIDGRPVFIPKDGSAVYYPEKDNQEKIIWIKRTSEDSYTEVSASNLPKDFQEAFKSKTIEIVSYKDPLTDITVYGKRGEIIYDVIDSSGEKHDIKIPFELTTTQQEVKTSTVPKFKAGTIIESEGKGESIKVNQDGTATGLDTQNTYVLKGSEWVVKAADNLPVLKEKETLDYDNPKLKQALWSLGYGFYDDKTKSIIINKDVVVEFQEKYELVVDGIVGPLTAGEINKALNEERERQRTAQVIQPPPISAPTNLETANAFIKDIQAKDLIIKGPQASDVKKQAQDRIENNRDELARMIISGVISKEQFNELVKENNLDEQNKFQILAGGVLKSESNTQDYSAAITNQIKPYGGDPKEWKLDHKGNFICANDYCGVGEAVYFRGQSFAPSGGDPSQIDANKNLEALEKLKQAEAPQPPPPPLVPQRPLVVPSESSAEDYTLIETLGDGIKVYAKDIKRNELLIVYNDGSFRTIEDEIVTDYNKDGSLARVPLKSTSFDVDKKKYEITIIDGKPKWTVDGKTATEEDLEKFNDYYSKKYSDRLPSSVFGYTKTEKIGNYDNIEVTYVGKTPTKINIDGTLIDINDNVLKSLRKNVGKDDTIEVEDDKIVVKKTATTKEGTERTQTLIYGSQGLLEETTSIATKDKNDNIIALTTTTHKYKYDVEKNQDTPETVTIRTYERKKEDISIDLDSSDYTETTTSTATGEPLELKVRKDNQILTATYDPKTGKIDGDEVAKSELNSLVNQYKVRTFFATVERVFTEFQGLGYYATLFFDEDSLLEWRDNIDRAFATLYLGTEYWSSAICSGALGQFDVEIGGIRFKSIEFDPGTGVAYAETPQGLAQVGAHIEATRSEPLTTPTGVEFLYKITFNVRNGDYDKDPRAPEEMNINVFLRGERTATVFKQDQTVKRGSSSGRIGRNAIVKYSTAFYNEVCLTFDRIPLRWKIDNGELCNIIVQTGGTPTSVPSSGTSTPGGTGGEGDTNDI